MSVCKCDNRCLVNELKPSIGCGKPVIFGVSNYLIKCEKRVVIKLSTGSPTACAQTVQQRI